MTIIITKKNHKKQKNKKNFHFRSSPDKANDFIFFKTPKPCFGSIFDLLGIIPNVS